VIDRKFLGLAALALIAAGVSACFRGTLPAREYHRLATECPAVALPSAAGALREGSLAISPYRVPGIYGDGRIVYRTGETGYNAYPNRDWAIPLGDMLGHLTMGVLAQVPVTESDALYDPPARRAQRYLWRGEVRRFEEVNRERDVFVAVELSAQLVLTATDSVVWSGSESIERPVAHPTMEAIIGELSGATCEVIERLAVSARQATGSRFPESPRLF
jgi:uncharacterized lipoprotein YmbA